MADPFVGREKELERLHYLLQEGWIPVVTGAGGIGKSELVRQYAFRHRDEYPGGMFQIDMERVSSWDDAFLRLLQRGSNTGVRVADCLQLKRGTPSGADVRDALLRRAREFGSVLLLLDNVEACGALFNAVGGITTIFPAGLADGIKINAIATARVFDTDSGQVENLPLGDLLPEAAVELLLSQHSADTAEERDAAKKVAHLLGYRALFLWRVPAIIGTKNTRNAKMLCRNYTSLAKKLRENAMATIANTGKVDTLHLPGTLWELTKEALAGGFLGGATIRLVRLAAHFPAEGFPRHILRRLWDAEVFPKLEGKDMNSDEAFDAVVDSCRLYNIFQDTCPVRIHRLDREAILKDSEADERELSNAIAKSLSGYFAASPEVWISLGEFPEIIRQAPDSIVSWKFHARLLSVQPDCGLSCPWNELDGWEWAHLLATQPRFESKCQWQKLNSRDWHVLLSHQPQFADKCPSLELEWDGESWANLLSLQPCFADKCPWNLLDAKAWSLLLKQQPGFVDKCPRELLPELDWRNLLLFHPQLADKCPLDELDDTAWVVLISKRPEFADKCPWEMLAGWRWAMLLAFRPQYASKCPWETLDGKAWAWLLAAQPEFDTRCPWWKLQSEDWAVLLEYQPRYADKCPWQNVDWDGRTWVKLLARQPRFASKCPWQQLSGKEWKQLLWDSPQFADKCDWGKLNGKDWWQLLVIQPRFADKCDWGKWDGYNWASLLSEQPQFADKCPWEKLDGEAWSWLLEHQPQFADLCPWEKLNEKEWDDLLRSQPQFKQRRPQQDMQNS